MTAVRPVPDTPTHCTQCGAELEPLRRYGGLCKACVAKCPAVRKYAKSRLRVVRYLVRHGRRFVEVKCSCGRRRTMRLSTWKLQPPQCCKCCRLRAVDRHGFEAEYAR